MQESKGYQLEAERITRETTIRHISAVLKVKFSTDVVHALTPAIQNINDLQRLEQLLVAASEARIETRGRTLRMPKELMRESKTYQLKVERVARETTIRHISAIRKTRFSTEVVNALTPVIQNISDLQRREELHTAAVKVQNIT